MRIPCVVLVYFDFAVIRRAVEALVACGDRLELIVVENRSPHTDGTIRPYLEQLLDAGKITKYILFNKNISNNAFDCVLDGGHLDVTGSRYVMFTDGDLVPGNPEWLSEEIAILENHPEVFACSVTLSVENLPIHVYPEAQKWAPGGIDRGTYFEDGSGLNLLLLRADDLREILEYRKRHRLRPLDLEVAKYVRDVAGKRLARTKTSTARHLTWDSYADPSHPYTRLKLQRSFSQTWAHHRYCSYEVRTSRSVRRHYPLRLAARGWLDGLQSRFRSWFRRLPGEFDQWDWKDPAGQ